jgi:hypothetical protein
MVLQNPDGSRLIALPAGLPFTALRGANPKEIPENAANKTPTSRFS